MSRFRLSTTIISATAAVLAACSADADTVQEEAEDPRAEYEAEAAAHGANNYALDLGRTLDIEAVGALNERLAAIHAETGHVIHVATLASIGERDVRAVGQEMLDGSGADVLILVAPSDQALTIVGEGLDDEFVVQTGGAMVARFREDDMAGGINVAIDAVANRLANPPEPEEEEEPEEEVDPYEDSDA